jgi:hypothetical protein
MKWGWVSSLKIVGFRYERVLLESDFVNNFFNKWRKWLGNAGGRELSKKKNRHLLPEERNWHQCRLES